MAGEIIRKGDPTDHGGTVVEGSLTDICHGKPIAYMGHKVMCPQCKGTFPIVEGILTTTFYGKGVAVSGMKTACGATLIATQFTDIVETGGGANLAPKPSGRNAENHAVEAAIVAASAATVSPPGRAADKDKKIIDLYWTYGPDQIPVSGYSRFYVDLNLHIKTQNFSAGEVVDIIVEDDAGADILEGVQKLTFAAKVGADGSARLMNVFAGKTVITVPDGT